MKPIIFCGNESLEFAPELLAEGAVFDSESVDFVTAISSAILKDRAFQKFPEFVALAFWFRASRLANMKASLASTDAKIFRAPRGVVFHIAPGNVDTVFVYSWFLSLLCGNANLVRLSRRSGPALETFVDLIRQTLQAPEFKKIQSLNTLMTYDHDDALTTSFSERCDLRVIWGGDQTVERIRRLSAKAGGLDLAFPTRFSTSVLKARKVMDLEDANFHKLIENFFNDTFWFGQQACSSPISIYWVGTSAEVSAAQARFWPAFNDFVKGKEASPNAGEKMNRLEAIFLLGREAQLHSDVGEPSVRMQFEKISDSQKRLHGGNGLFAEIQIQSLKDLSSHLTSIDQTLAYFGWAREELFSLVQSRPRWPVEHIVPMGQALQFTPIWDGKNLFEFMTKSIWVE